MRDFQVEHLQSKYNSFNKSVIFQDNCNGTFNYIISGSGAGYNAEYSTAAALNKTNGIKLYTRAVGAQATDYVRIDKYVEALHRRALEYYIRFKIVDITLTESVRFGYSIYDGSRAYVCRIHIVSNTGQIGIYSTAGTPAILTGVDTKIITGQINTAILRVNAISKKYIDLTFNGVKYDLSSYTFADIGASTDNYAKITIVAYNSTTTQQFVYCDAVKVSDINY